MTKILIRNATFLDGSQGSLYIEGSTIQPETEAPHDDAIDTIIDASGKLCSPAFVNAHSHISMSLFRGFADDLPFEVWHQQKILPIEQRMSEEDCYWGAKLACLEMIRGGTTAVNDMYWHMPGIGRAIKESKIRAVLGAVPVISRLVPDLDYKSLGETNLGMIKNGEFGDLVTGSIAPHAVYSLYREDLEWCADLAARENIPVHLHLNENEWETDFSRREYEGMLPTELLEKTGILANRSILAHGVWLSESEVEILSDRAAYIAHCPKSNMKLASGGKSSQALPHGLAKKHGLKLCLGTDGPASNNNLDMIEEMKFAALLAKHASGDPQMLDCASAIRMATVAGAEALATGSGTLDPGSPADVILIDLDDPASYPHHDLASHLVYSMTSRSVDTTICNGEILMRDKNIPGASEIYAQCEDIVKRLFH